METELLCLELNRLQQLKQAPAARQWHCLLIQEHAGTLKPGGVERQEEGRLRVRLSELFTDAILVVREGADPIGRVLPVLVRLRRVDITISIYNM